MQHSGKGITPLFLTHLKLCLEHYVHLWSSLYMLKSSGRPPRLSRNLGSIERIRDNFCSAWKSKEKSNCILLAGEWNSYREDGVKFFSEVYTVEKWDAMNTNCCTGNSLYNQGKKILGEGDKPQKQVAQIGCAISTPRHLQSSAVYATGRSALTSLELLWEAISEWDSNINY